MRAESGDSPLVEYSKPGMGVWGKGTAVETPFPANTKQPATIWFDIRATSSRLWADLQQAHPSGWHPQHRLGITHALSLRFEHGSADTVLQMLLPFRQREQLLVTEVGIL